MNWLADALDNCSLTADVEGYLLGRGVQDEFIRTEGIVTWTPTVEPVPDPTFRKRYGEHGEWLDGQMVCPVWSPKGVLLGFEGRPIHEKRITDYRLPEAAWNPFWVGLKTAMPMVWAGGHVWVVEGLFDLCALLWAVPETDAVLASVRAQLSDRHVEYLRRFCRGWVNMTYDLDETGRNATHGYVNKKTGKCRWGALQVLQRVGLNCRDKPYKGGKDPGEIWDRGGVEAIKAAFPL